MADDPGNGVDVRALVDKVQLLEMAAEEAYLVLGRLTRQKDELFGVLSEAVASGQSSGSLYTDYVIMQHKRVDQALADHYRDIGRLIRDAAGSTIMVVRESSETPWGKGQVQANLLNQPYTVCIPEGELEMGIKTGTIFVPCGKQVSWGSIPRSKKLLTLDGPVIISTGFDATELEIMCSPAEGETSLVKKARITLLAGETLDSYLQANKELAAPYEAARKMLGQ